MISIPDDVCQVSTVDQDKVARLRDEIEAIRGMGELFKGLADETRARIALALSREELCVCDIASLTGLSLPAVSYHLRLLRALRLVKYRREGKRVFYSLEDSHIIDIMNAAAAHVREGEADGTGRDQGG